MDLGCGGGLLAMLAARAGAAQVVAVDLLPHVCSTARANVALNGLESQVHHALSMLYISAVCHCLSVLLVVLLLCIKCCPVRMPSDL